MNLSKNNKTLKSFEDRFEIRKFELYMMKKYSKMKISSN